jgi:hypothetical protein
MTREEASADRNERLRELHEQLERQVTELVTSEDWARMLQTASRFHRYSFGNVCLIMAQMPTATRVAGFNTWKDLGRYVRKGEHAIRILAPCRYKVTDDDGDECYVVRGFTTASVFDISQTEGEEVADLRPELVVGEAPAGMWDALAGQVEAAGFVVARCESVEEIGGANGRTDYAARTVKVRDDVDDAQAVKTLAHELAHILCDHEHDIRAMGCRGRLEVEAESVAYVVCSHAGMSTAGYSLSYVARWAGGDASVVRQTAEKVVKVAGAICETLDASERLMVAA